MVRRIFLAAAMVAGLLVAGAVTLGTTAKAQTQNQPLLNCYISDPDVKGMTNIRDKPGGKVLFQVRGDVAITVTVAVQPGSWWRIVDPEELFGDEHKIPAGGVWIHRSVLAVCTDNFDGHDRMLLMEPRADAPRLGFIGQFNALLRPLEMTADGEWVKVTYEPSEYNYLRKEKMTGWIQTRFTRDEDIESGDGYHFPWMYAYSARDKDVALLADPGMRKQTFVMEKGKDYSLWIANPRDGYWEVLGEYVQYGDKEIYLDDYSLVPGTGICMRLIGDEATVALYSEANEESKVVTRLKVGTEVHPLDVTQDRAVWGAEPQLVKVSPVGKPDVVGWVELFHLSSAPAPALTCAEVAGTYESYNEDGTVESRFVLTEDGQMRWIYENGDYETSFAIRGNRIYEGEVEVDAQTRCIFVYDPSTRNIRAFDGVYYRKK